jgi:hypothetical protein
MVSSQFFLLQGEYTKEFGGPLPSERLYTPAPGLLSFLVLMPEWFLIVGLLALLTGLGHSWKPLLLAAPLSLFALGAPVAHAVTSGMRAYRSGPTRNFLEKVRMISVTTLLHFVAAAGASFWKGTLGAHPPGVGLKQRALRYRERIPSFFGVRSGTPHKIGLKKLNPH